ncbi:hypothetical protein L3Q82_006073 [Scortum barcoo]|uniref:Uncharacterized protein n=1 Tax=Scortum barcoo TaxID=214431 RepID=A0ACB8X2H3_9TELE|nr:hypothetical protein L3Q82_006073 [Scortum barcoo]
MGSTTSCCVSASPKLRRNAHSRLESYHQESELSREETGCNLQHISDRENVDVRELHDNMRNSSILFKTLDQNALLPTATYLQGNKAPKHSGMYDEGTYFGCFPVFFKMCSTQWLTPSGLDTVQISPGWEQLNMEYNPSDHPRASTIFLSKSQNDVREKRKSLFINNHGTSRRKYSSCSTIFLDDNTVSQPNLKYTIKWDTDGGMLLDIFDEKLHPLSKSEVPLDYDQHDPEQKQIYRFVRTLFSAAQLTSECAIVTLVYLERLLTYAEIDICPGNWKRIVLGAILLASKVWDDQAVWNVDYCQILKDITVEDMNELERQFLELLQFNINVPSSVYAKYYFDLRSLSESNNLSFPLEPLSRDKAQRLETERWHQAGNRPTRRWSVDFRDKAWMLRLYPDGKTWWMLMLVLRLLVLLLAGFTLFSDEQERFICNTIQPGCSNVCFDVFAPVSILRLWFFHLVLLCLPHVLFAAYVAHKVLSNLYFGGFYCDRSGGGSPFTLENSSSSLRKAPLHEPPRFYCTYFLVITLQILLEIVFGAGQFFLFGLSVPKSFLCYEAPCTSGVECYISRPTEKTLMLNFMLGVSSASILLSLADLVSSVRAMVRWRRRREMFMEEMSKGEQSSMFTAMTTTEDSDRRVSLSGSSRNGLKDAKLSGGAMIKAGESANDKRPESKDHRADVSRPPTPISTPVPPHFVLHSHLRPPLSPRPDKGPAPNPGVPVGVKKLGQYGPAGANSGQQSDSSESQDKRAWV